MILVYCSREKIAKNWVEAVAAEFGKDKVFLADDIKDPSKIEIALTWKAPEKMLHQFPNLKLIQSLGAGVDHIFDLKNAIEGTTISRIIDPQLSEDMYEFVLSIVLSRMKNLTIYRDRQRENIWKEKKYRSISEVKIGLLGLGVIGSFVAQRLTKVGFRCMGWSKSAKNIEGVESFVGELGLHEMLAQSDFLINILPLTTETRGFINLDLLKKLKEGAYVINVGRGPHVVDQDLLEAIDSGIISGAALDVFHQEPLPKDHSFWANENIMLTPHIASLTNIETARRQIFENIRRHLNGEEILNQVSIKKMY